VAKVIERFGLPFLLLALMVTMVLLHPLWAQKEGELRAEDLKDDESVERPSPSLRDVLDKLPFDLNGFLETRGGMRTQNDPNQSEDASISEARLQLELGKFLDWAEFKIKNDFLYDEVLDEGDLDLREANVLLSPLEFADLKIGRQILTWGTGDLIFINDLFPKDWKSFFIGRDVEYLKAPSDALKGSFFTDLMNIDVVYVPQFDPDRFIDGERLSFWSNPLGRRAGENERVDAVEPDDWFSDFEVALRLSKNLRGYELAGYGYYGFWKSPAGMNPATGEALFPDLSVYGASIRGNIWKGIGNVEAGYYDSRDDRNGDDPNTRNSELRFLTGYEQEMARDFMMGIQYYLEYMMDHENYERTLPSGIRARDEDRHVVTLRLTKLLMNQNLKLSLFVYYSPSDEDAYLRPKVHYKITDQWSAELGANVFQGARDFTFFGQFEDNTNVYLGLRRSF
jgi:hypothetical protein